MHSCYMFPTLIHGLMCCRYNKSGISAALCKRIREENSIQMSIFNLNTSRYILYHNRAIKQPLAVLCDEQRISRVRTCVCADMIAMALRRRFLLTSAGGH
ncbi:hypothetical protein P5673_015747 [Acropora cervicornis]|uniref:Uncharacterized protein n=1 Tax=Acropora cervicornis TaxID=6130 RepID=A0AAD9QH65_ACRCE|nr:hypothetical protein P5673_015747 [Acropora cervicornis]